MVSYLNHTPFPHFHHWRCWTQFDLPQGLRACLLTRGSTTARMQAAATKQFRVQLHSQHWALPRREERFKLGLLERERVLIREVTLCVDDQAWLWARTVFPTPVLQGRGRCFRTLGERSIITLLRRDPCLHRGDFEIARLRHSPPSAKQHGDTADHWARRSVFHWFKQPLLITEIFLPPMVSHIKNA